MHAAIFLYCVLAIFLRKNDLAVKNQKSNLQELNKHTMNNKRKLSTGVCKFTCGLASNIHSSYLSFCRVGENI
jgi:hypothetical protein